MNTSLKSLEEALSIGRQIETLEKRLSSILRIPSAGAAPRGGPHRVSAATRAKLAAAARARWTRIKAGKEVSDEGLSALPCDLCGPFTAFDSGRRTE